MESKVAYAIDHAKTLMEHLPVAAYIVDLTGMIVGYNPAAEALWGKTPAGQSENKLYADHKVYYPDGTFVPQEFSPLSLALKSGVEQKNREAIFERPDGSRARAIINAIPIRNEQGELVGAVNALLDITGWNDSEFLESARVAALSGELSNSIISAPTVAEMLAKCALILKERLHAKSIRISITGEKEVYLSTTASGTERPNPTGIRPHEMCRRQFAHTRFPVVGSFREKSPGTDFSAHSGTHPEAYCGIFPLLINYDHKGTLEVVTDRPMSKPIRAEIRSSMRMLVLAVERVHTQAALKFAKEKAESANKLKSAFLANMSHEVRTPLNGIFGAAQLLGSSIVSAEQREYLELLDTAADSLLRVINDILDISKIEADHLTLVSEPFKPIFVPESAVRQLQDRAKEKSIALYVETPEEQNLQVMGDSFRLRQIIINLIDNALKFTAPGGAITVGCEISKVRKDNHVALTYQVCDNGLGIAKGDLRRIFDAFEQVDPSDTRKFGGTGLGLSICKKLAELMGGSLEVTSEPGVGSIFTLCLELPLKATDKLPESQGEVSGAAIEAPQVDQSPLHILIAEDNLVNQKMAMMLLVKEGHTVTIANDGKEAMEKLAEGYRKNKPFDLILMDCQMPILDGYAATEMIRKDERHNGKHIPIVALTAAAMKEDEQRCKDSGMDGFVSKPFDRKRLKAEIYRTVVKPL